MSDPSEENHTATEKDQEALGLGSQDNRQENEALTDPTPATVAGSSPSASESSSVAEREPDKSNSIATAEDTPHPAGTSVRDRTPLDLESRPRSETNKENAQKSKGPTSPEGKRRSSLNASTHGIYATTIILPGESRTAYRKFRKKMREDRPVDGPVEEMLLEHASDAGWRVRRLKIMERILLEHFQKRQALQVEHPITIINGKKIDVADEREDVLDRLAEDATPATKDIRRAFRKLTETEILERIAIIGRERRKLMKEFLKTLDELEKRRAKKNCKS